MIYRTFPPDPRLARHIACIWYLCGRSAPGALPDRILPDGCMELVFSLRTPFSQADNAGRFIRQPSAILVGQQSRFVLLQPAVEIEIIAARFKPAGAHVFFPQDLDELTDRHIALDQFGRSWGELAAHIGDAITLAERVRRLEQGLLRRLSASRVSGVHAAAALDLLHIGEESPRIEQIARALGISTRHLERSFRREVGLTPKHYSRLLRFRRMLSALDRAHPEWADLAARAGYSDQPHLVREFREFTGLTPRACLAGQTPFAAALLG